MRTLKEDTEPEERRPDAGDYFILSGESCTWYVSTAMARFIEATLDAVPRVRWITFVDLAGSRVRLDVRQVEYLCQSTAEQRQRERDFSRALTRERKADRDWSEEE